MPINRITRVYYPWHECEEFTSGMWEHVSGDEYLHCADRAHRLMAAPEEFKAAMARVLGLWPRSCEHNLTAIECNRRAWMGHAGCFVGVGSPEEPTRIGWHRLNKAEQDEADRVAQEVIDTWEDAYASKGQLVLRGCEGFVVKPRGRTSTDA